VHRLPPRRLRDLLPAAETIGDDERLWRCAADGGQQHELSDLHRHLVVIGLEAEAAGHAAASRVERLESSSRRPQHRLLIVHLRNRLVMAVAVEHHRTRELWRPVARHFLLQEFAQQKGLLR